MLRVNMFKCLGELDKTSVYVFTPFSQRSSIDILDPHWGGACLIAAYDWMERKVEQDDLFTPTTYAATEQHLPHPIVFKDNNKNNEDVKNINNSLKSVYEFNDKAESGIEGVMAFKNGQQELNHESKIDALMDFIDSKPFHYGVISTLFHIKPNDTPVGHAISFVKKGEGVSLFDPNIGEITFHKMDDFRAWFKKEAKEGVLQYLVSDGNIKKMPELFPIKEFNTNQINENKLSKTLTSLLAEKQKARSNVLIEVGHYHVASFSGDKYINPKNNDIINALKAYIEPHPGERSVGTQHDPGFRLAKQSLKMLEACKTDQPLFDAAMVAFLNNYPKESGLTEKVANAAGYLDSDACYAASINKLIQHFSANEFQAVNSDIIKPMERALKLGRPLDVVGLVEAAENIKGDDAKVSYRMR